MNILVIEDDLMMRRALGHNLLESGHTVRMASNGREAADIVEKNQNIDLVICDVMMPVLTGPSFLLMLKNYFNDKIPPIIIISGDKVKEDYLKKLDIPYNHFVKKPIDFKKFNDLVASTATQSSS
jgi:CheY-like chemotaxis protein